MTHQGGEYSWREIIEWLERIETRVHEAATQATTAATEAREAKDQAIRNNGRVTKLESWKHEMELWFAKQMARAEVEANVLLSRGQGKAIWVVISVAATIGAAIATIADRLT